MNLTNTTRRALYAALFASGLAALVHQLMWVRLLGEIFGHTIFAVQTVLMVFFLGVAAGAWAVSRVVIRRPLAAFVLIEGGIALWGVAFPLLARAMTSFYDRLAPMETETLPAIGARLLITFIALIVPATLMGATFPLAAAALGRHRVAAVYGVNTLGGAAGVLVAAFVVLPAIGIAGTIYAASALNVVAALLTIPAWRVPAQADEQHVDERSVLPNGALLLFLTGFSALALELLWTRALEQLLSGTIYTFATVLAVFLGGLALGGLLAQRLTPTRGRVAAILGGLAVLVAATPTLVLLLDRLRPAVGGGAVAESVLAGMLLLGPTTLMGLSFPMLLRLGRGAIGRLTAANTAGSVIGPMAAFLILPWLGLAGATIVFAVVTACVAVAVADRRAPVVAVLLVVAVAGPLVTRPLRIAAEPGEQIIAYRDDLAATVAVVGRPGEQRMKVNNSYSLGGGRGVFTERRQGHIPMFLHPDPRRILVLGVGTGNTLGAIALHAPERLVAVDLLPGVVDFASRYFASTNEGVIGSSRAQVVVGDATRLVRSTPEKFDLVIGDLFHPWQAGVSSLYSVEHFAHVQERLDDGGVFVQWLPLYQLASDDVRTITRTFLRVFPHAQAWLGNFGTSTPIVALVGSRTPIALSEERWRRAVNDPQLGPRLREVYLDHFVELYGSFVCDRPLLETFAGAGRLNSTSHPALEFSAARTLFADRLEAEKRASLEQLVRLAAAQDRVDRNRGVRNESWFDHRLGVRAFIVTFLALETGKWRAAAEAATIAAEKCESYDLPRRTLAAIAWQILAGDPAVAAGLFETAIRWNPGDERALAGLREARRRSS